MNIQAYFGIALFIIVFFWLFYRDGGLAGVKAIMSIIGIATVVMVSLAYDTWSGWPASHPVWGRRYQLVQAVSIPKGDDELLIIWGIPQFPIKKRPSWNPFAKNPEMPGTPIAFYIPDTPRNERDVMRAKMALRQGFIIFGEFQTEESNGSRGPKVETDSNEKPGAVVKRGGDTENFEGKNTNADQLIIKDPANEPGINKAPSNGKE